MSNSPKLDIKSDEIKKILSLIQKVNEINGNKNPIINLRTFKDQEPKYIKNFYYNFSQLEELIKFIQEENKNERGTHINFNYSDIAGKEGNNGILNEEIKTLNFIFIDLDFKEESQEEKDRIIKDFEIYLLQNKLEVCYRASGRGGKHYLMPINLENTEENTEKIKQFVKDLNKKFKTKAFDEQRTTPNSLLRLGGTYNFKEKSPILNKLDSIEEIDLKANIEDNTEFIKKIKVEKKQINLVASSPGSKTNKLGNNFFISFLETKNKWEALREDFFNAHERNNVFFKNMAIFLKQNPEYNQLVEEFINFLDDNKKNRLLQLKGYLKKDDFIDINIFELRKWINTYNLENFKEFLTYEKTTNNEEGFNYEIRNKEVRFFKTIAKEDKKTGEITYKNYPILEFSEFYKINAVVYNNRKTKDNKNLFYIRTTKDNYLRDYEDLVFELQVFIKQNLNRFKDNILEIKDFILYSGLLDDLIEEDKTYTTHFYFNELENKFLVPNVETIPESQNIIKCDLIQEIHNSKKQYLEEINFNNLGTSEFYRREINQDKVKRAIKILNELPRTHNEKLNYKFAFSYSIAGLLNNLFQEYFILGSVGYVGLGKSILFKLSIGSLWGTYNNIKPGSFSKNKNEKDTQMELKNLLPDTRPRYTDEVSHISDVYKEVLKQKVNGDNMPYLFSRQNQTHSDIYFINPFLESFTSNSLSFNDFSDFKDKYINLDFADIEELAQANQLKNNISNDDIEDLKGELIKHLGFYIYLDLININHKEELEKFKQKLNRSYGRADNHFLFLKYGEHLLNRFNLFNDIEIERSYYNMLIENNQENIYSQSDEIKDTINHILNDLEYQYSLNDLISLRDAGHTTYGGLVRFNKRLNDKGIYLKMTNQKVSLVFTAEFISHLNLAYNRQWRKPLNLKFKKDLFNKIKDLKNIDKFEIEPDKIQKGILNFERSTKWEYDNNFYICKDQKKGVCIPLNLFRDYNFIEPEQEEPKKELEEVEVIDLN